MRLTVDKALDFFFLVVNFNFLPFSYPLNFTFFWLLIGLFSSIISLNYGVIYLFVSFFSFLVYSYFFINSLNLVNFLLFKSCWILNLASFSYSWAICYNLNVAPKVFWSRMMVFYLSWVMQLSILLQSICLSSIWLCPTLKCPFYSYLDDY